MYEEIIALPKDVEQMQLRVGQRADGSIYLCYRFDESAFWSSLHDVFDVKGDQK